VLQLDELTVLTACAEDVSEVVAHAPEHELRTRQQAAATLLSCAVQRGCVDKPVDAR
jgi:hypothetical protein